MNFMLHHIFVFIQQALVRVAEVGYNIIAVREDLCKKILNSGAKGIEFKELNQTRW
ncbi:hypothetical protein NIES267_00320 [Calothrix parasitica NIES-267]|uniref:Uncharacterized protein n=1 Tax=Calothrix parasitica NIES-267 TaxID=1973488 RepID=A0A1Z4LH41_9CYAN|nr:hypothetical protein NIES267_00320 [Calothrix parasitica NIES-267]